MKSELKSFGLNPDELIARDGSGVSHINGVSAGQIGELLYAVQKEKWYPAFLRSLPVAGASDRMTGGTLRNRLKNTPAEGKIKAKTGSLTSVSSIAGYADTKTGDTLIFPCFKTGCLTKMTEKTLKTKSQSCWQINKKGRILRGFGFLMSVKHYIAITNQSFQK